MKDTRIETITAPLTLEQLQALGEGITPGIWSRSKDGRPELRNQNNLIESSGGVLVAYGQLSDADAILCAAAPDVRTTALALAAERDEAQEEGQRLRQKLGELAQDWRKEAADSRRVHGAARDSYSQTAGVLESCADQLSNILASLQATPSEKR